MKQIIKNYSFNAAARTITFNDFSSIEIERVLLVTNVTSNEVIYIFNTPSRGGTAANNVLTLEYNTSAMSNGDKLQITYDSAAGDPVYSADTSLTHAPQAMKVTTSGAITYVATAAPGVAQSEAKWQVKKIDESSGLVITWADGNAQFDNIATDLTALTYA